ncbi:MAG: hypothetical protein IKY91_05350, partial [Akkermansia sp.]|nr:hypothetical protein [Akkermansia sp.]
MFFLASMGISQAHEQAVMNYWWVMPEEAPASSARVIRVLGEKGERFEEVYTLERQARLENSPVVMQARLERQEMLRREAMALVKKLKAEGKSPLVAYEEAWARVYKNRWLTANWRLGSSKLEDMLLRMAAEDAESELTPEEQQWVLEALLENDDRLETEAGQELLRRLTRRLRELGYGSLYSPQTANDQVMKRFADALSTGMNSMAAYREALFSTHRNRIMHHTMYGYVAPWGIRVGGPRYYQAPLKVGTTEGTSSGLEGALAANPQPGKQLTAPGLNDVPAAEKNFLAVSPEDAKVEKDDKEDKETEEEKDEVKTEAMASSAAPAPSMRGFALSRAVAQPVSYAANAAAEDTADLQVSGTAAIYFNSDGLTASGNTVIERSGSTNRYNYTVYSAGSYNSAEWSTISGRNTANYWQGSEELGKFTSQGNGLNRKYRATASGGINKSLSIIEVDNDDKLYLGGEDYEGIIRVKVDTNKANPNTYIGSYLPE